MMYGFVFKGGRTMYGFDIDRSQYRPLRAVIMEPETTSAGNVALRIGREFDTYSQTVSQVEYVVLSPSEARALSQALRAAIGEGD